MLAGIDLCLQGLIVQIVGVVGSGTSQDHELVQPIGPEMIKVIPSLRSYNSHSIGSKPEESEVGEAVDYEPGNPADPRLRDSNVDIIKYAVGGVDRVALVGLSVARTNSDCQVEDKHDYVEEDGCIGFHFDDVPSIQVVGKGIMQPVEREHDGWEDPEDCACNPVY